MLAEPTHHSNLLSLGSCFANLSTGSCGRGALDLCLAAGIPESRILKWDMAEVSLLEVLPSFENILWFTTMETLLESLSLPLAENADTRTQFRQQKAGLL